MGKIVFKGRAGNLDIGNLEGLYMKNVKPVKVYWFPTGAKKDLAFAVPANNGLGKMYSFMSQWDTPLDGDWNTFKTQRNIITGGKKLKGLWISFKINGDESKQSYYWQYEKGVLDWEYIKNQLSEERRRNMNFYEKWLDDLEQVYEEMIIQAKEGLKIGASIGLAVIVIYFGAKYYIAKKKEKEMWDNYRSVAREVGRGAKD